MEDADFYRNKYRFKSQLHIFIGKYKMLILFLSLCFLLGIVTGLFTSSRYAGGLELDNVPDSNLVSFLQGDKGSFGVFFSYFIATSVVCLLIIFLNINKFFAVVNFLYFIVRGYSFGFTIFAMIDLFSFAGVINVILIIIPFNLAIGLLLIVISAMSIHKNCTIKKFGKACYCAQNNTALIIFLCVLLVVVLFLKCMCMPLIKITIIVN